MLLLFLLYRIFDKVRELRPCFVVFLVGKTMLMDMFYGSTDGIIRHRQRFHFHEVSEPCKVLVFVCG